MRNLFFGFGLNTKIQCLGFEIKGAMADQGLLGIVDINGIAVGHTVFYAEATHRTVNLRAFNFFFKGIYYLQ